MPRGFLLNAGDALTIILRRLPLQIVLYLSEYLFLAVGFR